jgi:hypothetical protein
MIRKSMLVVAAVGGLGLGVAAVGPAAGATQPAASPQFRISGVPPQAVNTPRLIVKSRDRNAHLANGYIFAGQKYDLGPAPDGSAIGPDIVDDHGRQVYFAQSPAGQRATDVRAQTYRGQRVLTFWQGGSTVTPGIGEGNNYIYDQHYKLIRTIHAHGTEDGQPLQADQHEFLLTPGNSAIIVAYAPTHIQWKGKSQAIWDCVIQEINLATAKVVFEWHSLTHVSPARSHVPVPTDNSAWDYFHINSVKIDTDHNLIVSARHTWAFYKVNRHHGNIMWQVRSGNHTTGAGSTFTIGKGAAFAWQHDPEPLGNNEYRVFDNNWNQDPNTPKGPAHVVIMKLDLAHHTATNLGHIDYSGPTMYAGSQGDNQQLPAGHVLIGWGAGGDITEVNANRQQILDAAFEGTGFNTYRAYKSPWVGTPSTKPSISMHTAGGKKQADVVWNGASTVARWRILIGPSPSNLSSIGTTGWRGLDTAFRLSSWRAYIKAVALDSRGRVLGRTAAIHT